MKIHVTVNGQRKPLETAINVQDFLKAEGYDAMSVAVAMNGHFVSKDTFATTIVNDGDTLEIVAPMQGG